MCGIAVIDVRECRLRNANRAVRVLRGLVEGTRLENPGHFSSQNDCIRHRPDEAQLGDIQHVSRVGGIFLDVHVLSFNLFCDKYSTPNGL